MPDAARYFLIYSLSRRSFSSIFFRAACSVAAATMRIPSMLSILMCVLDVVFNILLIFPSRELRLGGWTVSLPERIWEWPERRRGRRWPSSSCPA